MFIVGKPAEPHILVVRLGSMGDVIHGLPAVAHLKLRQPRAHVTWVVEAKWAPLLEDNPYVDRVVLLERGSLQGLVRSWRAVRENGYDCAVDFQGLLKSAAVAITSRAPCIYGFDAAQVRERSAAVFYTHRVLAGSAHVVDRNLELAEAASRKAGSHEDALPPQFPLPAGRPEGDLPAGDFVLASPLAGWGSKQWPMEHYRGLAKRLRDETGLPLVLNGPSGASFGPVEPAVPHYSGLPGLIHATRRAAAVIGVDSGPSHLAAALSKPGVAIFGPTDPGRNGPYGDSLRVLRTSAAGTTYKRNAAIDLSMERISPDLVFETLKPMLPAGCLRR